MIKNILELIWPRLEGEAPVYDGFIKDDVTLSHDCLETSLEFAKLMYSSQRERISVIESKSSINLGFFGSVVAILAFALKDILFQEQKSLSYDLALFIGGVLIVYILQVMHYSIKALTRRTYYSISEEDFLSKSKSELTIKIINIVKKNYDVINEKVDYMNMAHEFIKRIIWVMFVTAIILIFIPFIEFILFFCDLDFATFLIIPNATWMTAALIFAIFLLIINQFQIYRLGRRLKKDA